MKMSSSVQRNPARLLASLHLVRGVVYNLHSFKASQVFSDVQVGNRHCLLCVRWLVGLSFVEKGFQKY